MEKFGLENASHKRTSVDAHLKLSKVESGVDIDESIYISMIGCFLYLKASMPYITFVVGVCSRNQDKPKASHLTQVKSVDDGNSTSDVCGIY